VYAKLLVEDGYTNAATIETLEMSDLVEYKIKKAHRRLILNHLGSVRQTWPMQELVGAAGGDAEVVGADADAEEQVDEATAKVLTNNLLRELEIYSLITRSHHQSSSRTFSAHRLLLQVQQDELRRDEQKQVHGKGGKTHASRWNQALGACARMLQGAFEQAFDKDDHTTWISSRGLEQHVLAVLRASKGEEVMNECGARLSFMLGELHLRGRGAYATAKPMYERSLAMRKQVHGGEDAVHADIASSMHAIGCVFDSEGKYAEAREWHERSLAMEKQVHGGEDAVHAAIASSMHAIGNVCYSEGDLTTSKQYFERAHAMSLEVLPSNHPDNKAREQMLQLLDRRIEEQQRDPRLQRLQRLRLKAARRQRGEKSAGAGAGVDAAAAAAAAAGASVEREAAAERLMAELLLGEEGAAAGGAGGAIEGTKKKKKKKNKKKR
jgi:tetratricopeptide (TPR) repeat protein